MYDAFICEYCKKSHNGLYGSGRFCSEKCARGFSSKKKRKEINEKVSKKLRGRRCLRTEKQLEAARKGAKTKHEMWLKRNAKVGKTELDITNEELEKYRESHQVCEICGKPEKYITSSLGRISRLARDHNHENNHFRGLLCGDCNRKLGWYEANKKAVKQYLLEKDGSVE